MKALVVGGTGPTGHLIVHGLRHRGYVTTILHTGRHELPEIPADVVHIHANPFDAEVFTEAIADQRYDLCVAMYGRVRSIVQVMANACGRFISISGIPVYRGSMNADAWAPSGLPVPTSETAPRVVDESDDTKAARISLTEDAVLATRSDATIFRYPYVYGPYQVVPREWCIVRRLLDQRPFIVLPDGGQTLYHAGYAANLANAVLLAVDQPENSVGQVFNCGDDEVLTLRQIVEVACSALGRGVEMVSMPVELAVPARPLLMQPWSTHRVFDTAKIRRLLGYSDVVPAREAFAQTVQWLAEHRPVAGGGEERAVHDPFDYSAEDRLVAGWRQAIASLPDVEWAREPGFSSSYTGPGARRRKQ